MEHDIEDDGDESLDGIMTSTQIAAVTGVHRATICRLAAEHGIGTMLAKTRLFRPNEVEQMKAIMQQRAIDAPQKRIESGKKGGRAIAIKRWGHADGSKKDSYAAANPDRIMANRAVKMARTLKRLSPLPCETCGNPDKTVAHHDDYNKPLEIRWLCRTCHRAWHRHNKPIEKTHD
jgi:hypothetical protein